MPLITYTDKGLYCEQADVYIDPWKSVHKAIVTHAHSDHARWGMKHYLSTKLSEEVLRLRLGKDISIQTLEYAEKIWMNGVEISTHSAGHIPGSAQIRLAYKNEIWVISGDYKIEEDGISTPIELQKCTHFITESTFALPIYDWKDQKEVFNEVNEWWRQCVEEGKVCVMIGYSLGKAQRILKNIDHSIGPVYVHKTIADTNEALIKSGLNLPSYKRIEEDTKEEHFKNAMIICSPNAMQEKWFSKIKEYETAYCSGWMAIRSARKKMNMDRGFVISDHADWKGLNYAIKETEAEKVYVTHGYNALFARWLNEQGIQAQELNTLFDREE